MRIRAIAWSTFGMLVRNKIIILLCVVFLCLLLVMMTPLSNMRNVAQGESVVLGLVAVMMSLVSGFGSLLAAWSAAQVIAEEMKSGTILAVLARPISRWEFLLGKYLGVQLLMVIYAVFMVGMSYLLASIGGQRIHAATWILFVFPMLRYMIYSALAMLFVNFMHPVLALASVLITSILAALIRPGPGSGLLSSTAWMPLYAVLPSMNLLSESHFLGMTQASLKPVPWTDHATALAYGLDYAVVLLLLAIWAFHKRALARD